MKSIAPFFILFIVMAVQATSGRLFDGKTFDGWEGNQIHAGPPSEAWYKDIEIKALSK